MASSPNLDVTFDAWGSPIPLVMGHVRIMGKMIWGNALEVGTSVASPAFLSFAIGFSYQLDPLEWQWIECVAIWANGIKIFGGDNDLVGLTFTFYEGKEDAPIDPLILADKGANRTPAFRGLRYIVFRDFPLSIVGNALPMISAEFAMTKDAPSPKIGVADVLKKIFIKSGITLTTNAEFDDTAFGVVFMSDTSPVALARDMMMTYNYYLLDGNGAVISRRAINAGLTIDATLDVDDMLTTGSTPAITFERAEQSQIANILEIQYTDIDLAFTNGIQYAKRPIFPVREAASDMRGSIQLSFVLDADTSILLAYDQLYRGWTEQLTLKFRTTNILIEVGDVLKILAHELGDYTVRVKESHLVFSNETYNEITATALLKRNGVTVATNNIGDYVKETVLQALDYPSILFDQAAGNTKYMAQPLLTNGVLVTEGVLPSGIFGTAFASTAIPPKIPQSAFVTKSPLATDPDQSAGYRLQDGQYVYQFRLNVFNTTNTKIQRINKSDLGDVINLTLTTPRLPGNGSQAVIGNGFLYWGDRAPGGSGDTLKIYRLDLSNFTTSGLKELPLDIGTTTDYVAIGTAIVGTNLLISAFSLGSNNARLYVIDLTDATFSTYSHVTTNGVPAANQGYLGRAVTVGGFAYFLPMEAHDAAGNWDDVSANKNPQVWGAKVSDSPSATGGITYFNITDDSSVSFGSKANNYPWADSDNIYFMANGNTASPYGAYIARRKQSDLSVVSPGFDLTTLYDDTVFEFKHGISDGSFHYIIGKNRVVGTKGGAIIKLSQDFSASTMYFAGVTGPPSNDDFINAAPLALGTSTTTDNFFATLEPGEPVHPLGADGASIWYFWTAPAGVTSVTLDNASGSAILHMSAYTGTDLASLSLAGSNAAFTPFMTLTTVPGTRYYIRLAGTSGWTGTFTFTFVTP